MKRKAVLGIMLTLLFIGILSLTFDIQPVEAPYPIIYIRADGSIDPSTANITSPDNVTYTFTADINASIVVEKNNTVVDGAGYTLQGTGSVTGISSVSSNVTIKNMEIKAFWLGIDLRGSSNTVSGNNITENECGINLTGSSNTVSGNNITENECGIGLASGSDNTINGNNITENNLDGIGLDGSSNNTINGNNIKTNGPGIGIVYSSNNKILNNNVTNNDGGIRLYSSPNNTISENDITDNEYYGISIEESMVWNSPNNTISRNILVNNTNSIDIVGVLFTTISRNHIAENNQYGIILDAASNNTISANNITNNNLGIFYDGLCNNNTAYHNNFVDNAKQVEVSPGDVDAWDDGVEGNYWSNYTGVDSNHDGIGDSWHEISENNTDRYPLMGMFHSFNTSVGEYVNVVSNSTIDNFQHFESNSTIIIHVSNMTTNQTHGFCRVSIPYEVMSEPFNVTIDGANPTYWNYTLYDNGTHRWIYFEYEHTTREIVIIPEFPSFLILPLFMAATLLAVMIIRRKHRANLRVPA